MKDQKKKDELVKSVDAFANELRELARKDDIILQVRLEVFRELARWVAVKNKLSETEESGDGLSELRQRINRPPQKGAPSERASQRRESFSRFPENPARGGSALEAIKRALPRANGGDDANDGDDS
jgi:hypothetical protein